MSTGIVSSKEGHNESQIGNTKLGTKFWNVVDNITIRLTQSTDIKVVLTAGVNFFLPLNIGWHDKKLGSMTGTDRDTLRLWIMHSFEILKGVRWLMKVDRIVSQSNTQLTEWYADKFHVQRWQLPFSLQNDSHPLIPPSWLMSASFHFYKFKEGNKNLF